MFFVCRRLPTNKKLFLCALCASAVIFLKGFLSVSICINLRLIAHDALRSAHSALLFSRCAFARVVVTMALRIWVTVKPQAKKEEIRRTADAGLIASVQAPARQGKANEALIQLLASYFSTSKSSVRIIRGQTSRKKLIEIG